MTMGLLLGLMVLAADPCPAGDLACQREAFRAAMGQPGECAEGKEGSAIKEDGRDTSKATGECAPPSRPTAQMKKTAGASPAVVAGVQWGATLAADLLPAGLFALSAVALVVLPAGMVPAAFLAGLGAAAIPGLPVVQALLTNLAGDGLSAGTRRGRLVVQLAVAAALLGLQLVVAAGGLALTGWVLQSVAVGASARESRYLAWECRSLGEACAGQVQRLSATATMLFALAGVSALAVVALNTLVALAVKGPVLALAYALHAGVPLSDPYPRWLPRLAQRSPEVRTTPAALVTASAPRPSSVE